VHAGTLLNSASPPKEVGMLRQDSTLGGLKLSEALSVHAENHQCLRSLSEQGNLLHVTLAVTHRLQRCWPSEQKSQASLLYAAFSNCFESIFLDISKSSEHPELSPGLLVNTLQLVPKSGKVSGPGPLLFHLSINLRG